ncbi:hypothetical protein PROVRETT_09559 [Providencia rettgeri DSM 1131]|nr:hypothetical protein PROVRETT_09559 [Providencia rettgeri DSM 1131]
MNNFTHEYTLTINQLFKYTVSLIAMQLLSDHHKWMNNKLT